MAAGYLNQFNVVPITINKLHTFHYDQKNYQKITMAGWLQEGLSI